MQGRLVPPIENRFQSFPVGLWENEFPAAATAGLSSIEWIYDQFGADENPLNDDSGIARIQALAGQHQVAVRSVCADYFLDRPFLRTTHSEFTARSEKLRWLIQRCALLGVRYIVLPFVDASRIESPEEARQIVSVLESVLTTAESFGIELHLETSLPPNAFAELLEQTPHALVRVNYDSGNSASLGYSVREEFASYGNRIGSVHIKDRIFGGGTVPLGSGDADLDALFDELNKMTWKRPPILQVARSTPGDEVAWARHNREFVEARWQGENNHQD